MTDAYGPVALLTLSRWNRDTARTHAELACSLLLSGYAGAAKLRAWDWETWEGRAQHAERAFYWPAKPVRCAP